MPPLSAATLAYGRRVATGLLGVDALARLEGEDFALAVVNMDTKGEFSAEPFAGGYEEARGEYTQAMLFFFKSSGSILRDCL